MAKVILTSDILNKREDKFRTENPYYFGSYYDLSDTSAEDLELEEEDCDGDNDEPTIKNNTLNTVFFEKDGIWYFNTSAQYSVTSDLEITFNLEYNSLSVQETFKINKSTNGLSNQPLNIPFGVTNISVKSIVITPEKDETYKYISNYSIKLSKKIYYGTWKYNTIDSLTSDDVLTNMTYKECVNGDNEIVFSMPYVIVENTDEMSDEEFDLIVKENAKDFIILYNGNITNYSIMYADADIIDAQFVKIDKTINVNGQPYNVLVRSVYKEQSPIREEYQIPEGETQEIHKRNFIIK